MNKYITVALIFIIMTTCCNTHASVDSLSNKFEKEAQRQYKSLIEFNGENDSNGKSDENFYIFSANQNEDFFKEHVGFRSVENSSEFETEYNESYLESLNNYLVGFNKTNIQGVKIYVCLISNFKVKLQSPIPEGLGTQKEVLDALKKASSEQESSSATNSAASYAEYIKNSEAARNALAGRFVQMDDSHIILSSISYLQFNIQTDKKLNAKRRGSTFIGFGKNIDSAHRQSIKGEIILNSIESSEYGNTPSEKRTENRVRTVAEYVQNNLGGEAPITSPCIDLLTTYSSSDFVSNPNNKFHQVVLDDPCLLIGLTTDYDKEIPPALEERNGSYFIKEEVLLSRTAETKSGEHGEAKVLSDFVQTLKNLSSSNTYVSTNIAFEGEDDEIILNEKYASYNKYQQKNLFVIRRRISYYISLSERKAFAQKVLEESGLNKDNTSVIIIPVYSSVKFSMSDYDMTSQDINMPAMVGGGLDIPTLESYEIKPLFDLASAFYMQIPKLYKYYTYIARADGATSGIGPLVSNNVIGKNSIVDLFVVYDKKTVDKLSARKSVHAMGGSTSAFLTSSFLSDFEKIKEEGLKDPGFEKFEHLRIKETSIDQYHREYSEELLNTLSQSTSETFLSFYTFESVPDEALYDKDLSQIIYLGIDVMSIALSPVGLDAVPETIGFFYAKYRGDRFEAVSYAVGVSLAGVAVTAYIRQFKNGSKLIRFGGKAIFQGTPEFVTAIGSILNVSPDIANQLSNSSKIIDLLNSQSAIQKLNQVDNSALFLRQIASNDEMFTSFIVNNDLLDVWKFLDDSPVIRNVEGNLDKIYQVNLKYGNDVNVFDKINVSRSKQNLINELSNAGNLEDVRKALENSGALDNLIARVVNQCSNCAKILEKAGDIRANLFRYFKNSSAEVQNLIDNYPIELRTKFDEILSLRGGDISKFSNQNWSYIFEGYEAHHIFSKSLLEKSQVLQFYVNNGGDLSALFRFNEIENGIFVLKSKHGSHGSYTDKLSVKLDEFRASLDPNLDDTEVVNLIGAKLESLSKKLHSKIMNESVLNGNAATKINDLNLTEL